MKYGYATHSINPLHVIGGGKVWNFGFHCTKVSDGCQNCWSETQNNARGNGIPYDDRDVEFVYDDEWYDKLPQKKPGIIAMQYMGDILHRCVPDRVIQHLFFNCALFGNSPNLPSHQFLILTKRPERLLNMIKPDSGKPTNIWLGASIENQKTADERIPKLLKIPAAKRWLSIEPMLGPVSLRWLCAWPQNKYGAMNPDNGGETWHLDGLKKIDWIVIGCESGPNRRPCEEKWIRSIKDQCADAGVPLFIKQMEIDGKVTTDINLFPEDLRVRQWPEGMK